MPETDHNADNPATEALLISARPATAGGAVRRISHGLLQARLFGRPLPVLGRFQVQRKLGEGGMGTVFEALDPHLGRAVALKVLRDAGDLAARTDIAHEARVLARLSHPNVVTVYELGDEEGERYVCMERVDGPNLAAWVLSNPGASWRTLVGHLLGAARGLAAAHRAGVVHRDFKLENVLLGSDGVARVTDFGLARVEGPDPTAWDVGGGGGLGLRVGPDASGEVSSLAGTPGYVAPEVVKGARATEKSDQYSFFIGLRIALHACGGAPPALASLVKQGTSADPDARLSDMQAVVAALEATLAPRPAHDQRALGVLRERVQQLWVGPARARALRVHSGELPLRCEPDPALVDTATPLELGDGSPAILAEALHAVRAGVVLVGAPGAGKTIRLLGVAEALLQRAADDPDITLPVVLSLSSFPAFRGSLPEWLLHELVAKYALPRQQAQDWLEAGRLALLLDGLDEVGAPDRGRCVDALNALRAERPTPYLVTCREENYRALGQRLRGDAALRLCPLDATTLSAALQATAVADRLQALIREDPALVEQLKNPLLLSLFAQLAQTTGALAGAELRATELRERLYTLALEHALHRPPMLDDIERARAEAGLRWLASAMTRAGVTELWLEELQASWLPRRSQRVLAQGLGLSAAFVLSITINLAASRVAQQPWYSGLFFGIIAAAAAFVIQGGLRVVPMEAMGWSWSRVRTWVPRNLALGVITGGLHGVFFDFWADLMLGVATGLLGLSVIGLAPAGRERRVNPGDGLLESLRNSLMVAPVIGLVIGVPVGYLVLPLARPLAEATSMYYTHPNPELSWAVTMGTSAAVTSLYITGFLAPLMHAALRLTIAWTSPLPLRLAAWLDDMAHRDLLHRVGGGWSFRHPTLRAWLAANTPPR